MRLTPDCVVLAHRLDQPVVGQLEPGRAAALLGAHQMGVDERPDAAVLQALPARGALSRPLQHLTADALWGDELTFCPVTDRALTNIGLDRDRGHAVRIVAAQRSVYVTDLLHIGDVNQLIVSTQTFPHAAADDLQLHRLDGVAGDGGRGAIGQLHPDGAQVVGQFGRGRAAEINTRGAAQVPAWPGARRRTRADQAGSGGPCQTGWGWRAGRGPGRQ